MFLSFNGNVYPNNSLVITSLLAATTLICHTNRSMDGSSEGGWFTPDNMKITSRNLQYFKTRRQTRNIELYGDGNILYADEGIYRCSILDAASTIHSIFVGIYRSINTGGK